MGFRGSYRHPAGRGARTWDVVWFGGATEVGKNDLAFAASQAILWFAPQRLHSVCLDAVGVFVIGRVAGAVRAALVALRRDVTP